ncbi:RNA-directed DNA polymerase [Brevundimonas sp.]|uniref:RNA-directed DNA polymerase n=1 Tax=Brevundimonas sp. TaxID=1871086 RepID=UPI001AD053B4|nr:RNA-directed DNA polymerase [Brevundimonas sp.]MBN9465147.1 RNA-directed DNA polymerase [Brevundimonas sp.]
MILGIREFSSWSEVELEDLLAAFRKAKADCFFERSAYVAEQFAEYEEKLFDNLQRLLDRLRAGDVAAVFAESQHVPGVFAKGVIFEPKHLKERAPHAFFSDAERAFERLRAAHDIIPEFRVVGNFAVDMHVVSGLWINCIGHKFDARLSGHAFGSRVRRYGREPAPSDRPQGAYQYEAIGTFDPYFQPYRRWRDSGVAAIRTALEADDPVVALTLDFSAYYHCIDPQFIVDERFLSTIGLQLSNWEIEFSEALVAALKAWSLNAATMIGVDDLAPAQLGGLPIGLSAVRIITNVLLFEMDEAIISALHPIYYGRYVDDVFLVIKDSGRIKSPDELWSYISNAIPMFELGEGNVEVRLPGGYQGETRLRLKPEKQRVFFLQGQAGKDLLGNIAHQVRTLSSERRLMPLVDEMDSSSASARALAAAASAAEEPDSLRRADGLTLRRLGWALQLRSAEILARDLNPTSWTEQRRGFYDFACSHILRPDKILEHVDYLARLISLAVSLADWSHAHRMFRESERALEDLQEAVGDGHCKVNGEIVAASPRLWADLRTWVRGACREAILRSLPWDGWTGAPRRMPREAERLFALVGIFETKAEVARIALSLREADLAKRPYKEHLRHDAVQERTQIGGESDLTESFSDAGDRQRLRNLQAFLHTTRGEEPTTGVRRRHERCDRSDMADAPSLLPYLLATRPYTAQEVALYKPDECVFGPRAQAFEKWGAYTRAVRGAWHGPADDQDEPIQSDAAPPFRSADLGAGRSSRPVRLGVTSLETTKQSWEAAALGRPDLTPARYDRLSTIVNLAINARPRPTHLLLPELSVPDRWLPTITSRLLEAGISLIAGLDYEHYIGGEISSSAALVLRDDRLGFPSSIEIRQPKLQPAPGEEEDLYRAYGNTWKKWPLDRHPVYIHDGVYFGLLVCSELQNIRHREAFQGYVDLLAVLSWNRDLDTFSALVESASLDVHA